MTRIIQLAFNAGFVEIDLMPVMLKRLSFTGSALRSRPDQFKADVASVQSGGLAALANAITLALPPARFALAEAGKARTLMESANKHGKIPTI